MKRSIFAALASLWLTAVACGQPFLVPSMPPCAGAFCAVLGLTVARTIVYSGGVVMTLGSITGGASYTVGTHVRTLGAVTAGTGGTSGVYTGVPLTGGAGTGAVGTITVGSSGTVLSVSVTSTAETGYLVADVLSAASGNIGGVTGFSVPVATVGYKNVNLTGGTCSGVTANITVSAGGAISAVALVNRGTGCTTNDALTAASSDIGGTGSGFSVPASQVGAPSSPDNAYIWQSLPGSSDNPGGNAVSGNCADTVFCTNNLFAVGRDLVSTNASYYAYMFTDNYGGAGATGSHHTALFQFSMVATPSDTVGQSYTTLNAWSLATVPPPVNTSSLFGMNTQCKLGNGATGWSQCVGFEVDVDISVGATLNQKIGVQVVDQVVSGPTGAFYNAAYSTNSVQNAVGWDYAFVDGGYSGFPSLAATGTFAGCYPHTGTGNCGTIGAALDFWNYLTVTNSVLKGPQTSAGYGVNLLHTAFSNYAYVSPGFSVDPSGFAQIGTGVYSFSTSGPIIDAKGALGTGTPAVSAGGSGYTVGDFLYDSNNGIYKVATRSGTAVATVTVVRQPFINSTSVPANPVATTTNPVLRGGPAFGSGATLNLSWNTTGSTLSLNPSGGSVLINGSGISPTITTLYSGAQSATYTFAASKMVHYRGCGGGGSGGSGGLELANVAASGGGGGAGGGCFNEWARTSDLTPTKTITVGAGGAAVAAQTTNTTAGLNGNPGTITCFGGTIVSNSTICGGAGGGGAGGQLAATASGGGGAGTTNGSGASSTSGTGGSGGGSFGGAGGSGAGGGNGIANGAGAGGGGTSVAGFATAGGSSSGACSGGGAGGGLSAIDASNNGGAGGLPAISTGSHSTSSTGGTSGTPTGGSVTPTLLYSPGFGGGGGFGNGAGNSGAGGNGTQCGGGGGGGTAVNGSTAGASGAGGDGWIIIEEYFHHREPANDNIDLRMAALAA